MGVVTVVRPFDGCWMRVRPSSDSHRTVRLTGAICSPSLVSHSTHVHHLIQLRDSKQVFECSQTTAFRHRVNFVGCTKQFLDVHNFAQASNKFLSNRLPNFEILRKPNELTAYSETHAKICFRRQNFLKCLTKFLSVPTSRPAHDIHCKLEMLSKSSLLASCPSQGTTGPDTFY